MPDFTVRVFQVQLLCGSADVSMTDVTPEQAAEIVLAAVEGDPDDETGDRRYRLRDGRFVPLDPEDCIVGGRIYCQVLDAEHRIVGLHGDLASCDVTEGAPQHAPSLTSARFSPICASWPRAIVRWVALFR